MSKVALAITLATILSLATASIFFAACPAQASNPFIKTDNSQEPSRRSDADAVAQERIQLAQAPGGNPIRHFFEFLLPLQRKLHTTLSSTFLECKEQGAGFGGTLLLLGAAFLYGLVHAIGPGHGKSVATAYFLARGGKIRHGFHMGMTTAMVHAASATALVLVLKLILETAVGRRIETTVDTVSQVSFLAIALIGLGMFAIALRKATASAPHAAAQIPGPDRGFFKMAIVSGIVPCPGAAIILIFAMALDLLWLGIAAVAAMSLGMGLTISAVGTLTLFGRNFLLSASPFSAGKWRWLGHGLSLAGALLVMVLGLLFFWASLSG